MSTPYIFFDVDGVLNCQADWHKQHFFINNNCMSQFVDLIAKIQKKYKTKPKLVTCSTWRAGFNNKNLSGDGISLLEKQFKDNGLSVDDATPISNNKARQEEIEYYIRRNHVTTYIVIDDDVSLFDRPSEINLYVPDFRTGLTKQDIDKITKQLQKPNHYFSTIV